ncbi:MAG: hypothetical protein AAF438_20435 [Pseudomonadota bacterium]
MAVIDYRASETIRPAGRQPANTAVRMHNYLQHHRVFLSMFRTLTGAACGWRKRNLLSDLLPRTQDSGLVSESVESLYHLVRLLIGSARRTIRISHTANCNLTTDEQRLLACVQAIDNEQSDLLSLQLQWYFSDAADVDAFARTLNRVIDSPVYCALKADSKIPLPPVEWQQSVETTANLTGEESEIINVIRDWVGEYKQQEPVSPRSDFNIFIECDQWQALNEIMEIAAQHARRKVEVRCSCCGSTLSQDESIFLDAIASTQHGIGDIARILFLDMLPPAGIDLLKQPLNQQALSLSAEGIILPMRAWKPTA